MARSEAWHKYQQDTAALFASLGLNAALDVRIQGARTHHDIDVAVRFRQLGIDHLWVVECKQWKSPVKKATVLTLKQIVEDVGADLGIMVTEHGAQSGAISAARFSNILITNLEDLASNAREDLLELRWSETYSRAAKLEHAMTNLWSTTIGGDKSTNGSMTLKVGVSWDDFVSYFNRLQAVTTGVSQARLGKFPAPYDFIVAQDGQSGMYRPAENMGAFLDGARTTLDELEPWVVEQQAKPWS